MQGHWIGGTRKLNRHWQSGEDGEQLVIFDIPENDPSNSPHGRMVTVGNNWVYTNGGYNWHQKPLKLKNKKYAVRWDIHPCDDHFYGIEGICANTGVTGFAPLSNEGYVAGTLSDPPYRFSTAGPPGFATFTDPLNNPDLTINWFNYSYYEYSVSLGTTKYKYIMATNSSLLPDDCIFDFRNTPKAVLDRVDVILVTFIGNYNNFSTNDILWGKMWLEPV